MPANIYHSAFDEERCQPGSRWIYWCAKKAYSQGKMPCS